MVVPWNCVAALDPPRAVLLFRFGASERLKLEDSSRRRVPRFDMCVCRELDGMEAATDEINPPAAGMGPISYVYDGEEGE